MERGQVRSGTVIVKLTLCLLRRRSEIKAKRKMKLIGMISLVLILLASLSLTACTSGLKPGWAGTVVYEYTFVPDEGDPEDRVALFVGSMNGTVIRYDLDGEDAFPSQKEWEGLKTQNNEFYGRPVVAGELLYVADYKSGKVYKVNVENGLQENETPGGQIVGGVAVGLGMVFVGTSDGVLHALNADDLSEVWRYPEEGTLTDRIWGTPTIEVTDVDDNEGVIYFGGFDHNLYALDQDGREVWTFEAGGAIAAKPLIYDDKVYFGSFDRKFYALNKADGTEAWSDPFIAGNWFWTEAIAADGLIYVGCLDHRVYALDATTGEMESEFLTDSPISSPPLLVEDTLVVASNKGMVYGLSKADLSSEKWTAYVADTVQAPLSVYGDYIYVYGRSGNLYALLSGSGTDAGIAPYP